MQFNQGYYHPMDREYNSKTADEIGLGVKGVGMSVPFGISAADVQGLQSKIRMGAGNIEIQFPGAGRGSRQAPTPEMFGREQREAIKEMAKVSEVKLTTHATWQIMGLSGADQQGNFSKEQRKMAIDEIKRAIEFARDTALGGSVVVHTGEFARPISEESWAKQSDGSYVFKGYPEEPERAVLRVVDERTGQVMQNVRKNQVLARPVWKKAEKTYIDDDGNEVHKGDYIDYEDKLTDIKNRVPEFDPATGRFKVSTVGWDTFVKEAEERNKIVEKEKGRPLLPDELIKPEEAFLRATLETNEGHSRGWALQYAHDFDNFLDTIKKLEKAKAYYEQLDKSLPPEERWRIMMQTLPEARGILPPETKHPLEIIEEQLRNQRRQVEYSRQASTAQQQQAEDSLETQGNIVSVEKYALKESVKGYAEAGIFAMEQTKDQQNPLFISMENIFPEMYGGHPQELKDLIMRSREEMSRKLREERNLSKKEANELAEKHIKGTFDTAHIHTWRKYWQNDQNKSLEENDREFNKWLLKETETIARSGVIGNIHISDNFGYQDDHLAPGQGKAPIKEIMDIFKKHGYEKAITVEPSNDFEGLLQTWRFFGSPIYGAQGFHIGTPRRWSDIQYAYFGQAEPPHYVFGAYSPSNDWTLWSQVQFE